MSFKPGHEKVGGRILGTRNKKISRVAEILEELDIEPVKEIIALLPDLTAKERVDVLRDLLNYIYPRLKSVEVSKEVDSSERPRVETKWDMIELINLARGEQQKEQVGSSKISQKAKCSDKDV